MKERIARQFGLQADRYDRVSLAQQTLAERLAHTIPTPAGCTLDIGAGTGHLALRLAQHGAFPLHILDISETMLSRARSRLLSQAYPDPIIHIADAEQFEPPRAFRTIASSAAVQWFTNPRAWIARAARWLEPQGILLIGTFGPQTLGELYAAYRQATRRELDSGARPVSAEELGQWLKHAGLRAVETRRERMMQTWDSPRALLRDMKSMGVTGIRPQNPLNRQELQRLESALIAADNRTHITWELVWGWGFK